MPSAALQRTVIVNATCDVGEESFKYQNVTSDDESGENYEHEHPEIYLQSGPEGISPEDEDDLDGDIDTRAL